MQDIRIQFFQQIAEVDKQRIPIIGSSKSQTVGKNLLAHMLQNRYRELMRVSRQWRNLQVLKRAGLAHEPNKIRTPGDLALFCATCPQPGINLPLHEPERSIDKFVHVFDYLTLCLTFKCSGHSTSDLLLLMATSSWIISR
jgi:hypothetical protein